MNLREGTRRLALLLGAAGAIIGGVFAYAQLQSTMRQRADHKQFEQLANSDAVQQDRKDFLAGWVSIDSKTGERIQWDQQVDKGGIKTIHWTKDNEIESIEAEDGQTLYPTPAPSAWLYLLIALFPVLGFLIPWGVVRSVGWVGAGFVQPAK
jgi:predicted small secreted protein